MFNNNGARPHREDAPSTVKELIQRNVTTIAQLEEATKTERTFQERLIGAISRFCGSMRFVWAHAIWFTVWALWNTLPPLKPWRFDDFPFYLLCTIMAAEAIFLSSFILMSQNRESQISERRNHLDLQINLLSEQENTKMLQMLKSIAEKVGADIGDDPDIRVLEAAAQPEMMLEQIDESIDLESTQKA